MKKLIELIGEEIGVKDYIVSNAYNKIDNNIAKLVEVNYTGDIRVLIKEAITYSISLQLQMKFKSIVDYVLSI